jgi:Nuclear transport factor 2 (NTF2) domain
LVIGQKNIHDKIQQMNFRDCHAKISHVDAQATLGDGVVVQVFGELSNDGNQMRRFTQTFVLACQSPKKYYVHNDIFRYHDIYSEDEEHREEHEESSGATTNNNSTDSSNAATMIVQPNVYYPPPPAVTMVTSYPVVAAAPPAPQVNGVIHEEMLKNMATQTTQAPQLIAAAPVIALPIPVEPVAMPAEVIPIQSPNAVIAPNVINEAVQFQGDQSNGEESDTLDNSKETESSDEPGMFLLLVVLGKFRNYFIF